MRKDATNKIVAGATVADAAWDAVIVIIIIITVHGSLTQSARRCDGHYQASCSSSNL